jgi:outer membrane protein OmpU
MRDIMKRLLLASAALAVAAVGSAANAAEPVAVTVNGFFVVGMGYTDSDFAVFNRNNNASRTTDDFGLFRDGEIRFNFRGTSDNGLTFRGRVDLEAGGARPGIDRSFAGVVGAFGSVDIGTLPGRHASYGLSTGNLVTLSGHAGVYDTFFQAGPVPTNNRFARSLTLQYQTPSIAGFIAGVSYSPSYTAARTGADYIFGGDDLISVGLNYQASFGNGIGLTLAGGYDYINENSARIANPTPFANGTDSQDAFTASILGSFSGFRLGLLWKENLGPLDSEDWMVNADYKTGPWTFGLGYVLADFSGPGAADTDTFAGWLTYALAPGVTVGTSIHHIDQSGAGGASGTSGYVMMGLSF